MGKNKTKAEILIELEQSQKRIAELESASKRTGKRQSSESTLHETEETYRALVETLNVSLCRWQPDTTLTFANEKYKRIFGIQGDAVGQKWIDFLPEEVRETTVAFYNEVTKDPRTITYEHPVTTEDGSMRDYHWTDTPVLDASGKVTGFYSVGIDITERKHAETILAESDARTRELLEATPDAIIIMDAEGKIQMVNARTEVMFGYTTNEMVGAPVEILVPESLHGQHIKKRAEFMSQPYILTAGVERVIYAVRKTGEIFPVEISIGNQKLMNGETVVLCAIRDVTERQRSKELITAQRDLAKMVNAEITKEEIWQTCLSIAIRISKMDSGGLYLFDDTSRTLDLVQHQGLKPEFVAATARFEESSPSAQMVLGGKTLQFTESDLNKKAYHHTEGLRSILVVPITHHEKVVGCLNIASHTSVTISDWSRNVLEALAVEIGNIIIHQQIEASLKISSQQLSHTLIAAQMGTWRYHIPTDRMEWSPETSQIFGIDISQDNFQSILKYFHPDDMERVFAGMQEALKQRQILNLEYRIFDNNGKLHWITNYGRVECDTEGNPVALMGIVQDITDRKMMENALEAEAVRRHILFEEAPDGILVIDPQTARFLEFNAMAHTQLGYTRDEFANMTIFDVEVKENIEQISNHIEKVLKEGRSDFETLQRTKQGEIRNVFVTAQVVEILGEPVYYCIWRDITAQKRMEEARRESDERYHLLFETMAQGVVFQDADGRIIQANAAAERILGLTFEQMQGRTSIDTRWHSIHEDGSPFPGESHPAMLALKTGEIVENTVMGVFNPATASYRWININAVPRFFDHSEKPYQVYTTLEDITARKQSEENLRESRSRIEMAVKGANAAMWDWNVQTGETLFNERWAEISGYTLAELEPVSIQTWIDLCHPDDLNISEQLLTKHFAGETEYYHCEARMKHKNGSWVWVLDSGRVMEWDVNGAPLRMFGTHLDITKRKQEERYTRARLTLANLSNKAVGMETLMRTMLDEAEALTGSQIGFFHFVDDDQNTIYLQTWSTNTLNTLCNAEGKGQHYPVVQAGVWADSIRKGEPVTYNDYNNLPHRRDLPEGHAPITRLISVPIKRNNLIVAVIGVGNKASDYDEHDLGMVRRLAEDAFDIILRKRAEEALHASEEKYRGLLASLDSVIANVDHNGNFLYLNEKAATELGGNPEQYIGKNMSELFPQQVSEEQLKSIAIVIEKNQGHVTENLTMIQGEPRWYRTSIQPLHDENGCVASVLINSTDIHEIKSAQQQLQELNHTLEDKVAQRTAEVQDLYENAPTGYHSIDANGNIILVNQTELAWLGYTREEMLGRPARDFLTEESCLVFDEYFTTLLRQGWLRDVELDFLRKDGSVLPSSLNATALCDEYGSFVMSRSTIFDITERKKAEKALHERERNSQSLLRLSHKMEQAESYQDVLNAAGDEVKATLGYQALWTYLLTKDKKQAHLLIAGDSIKGKLAAAATLDIQGDQMLEEIVATNNIIVVEDARADPRTNKDLAEMLGSRTIVNVPIILFDRKMGAVGVGTFGDEGIRVPTTADQEYLISLASHMAVTFDRIHLLNQRQQAKEELVKLNQQDQAALRIARMGHWEFDPESNLFLFNDQYYLLHRTSAEAAGGYKMPIAEFMQNYVHPNDANEIFEAIQEGVKTKDPKYQHQMEARIIQMDGKPRNVVLWFRVEKDSQGRTTKLHGVIQDITERKRAEDELKLNVNFTNALLNSIPTPVFYKNREGRYLGCNRAFSEMMGKKPEDIQGKLPNEVWLSEQADIYRQKDIELMEKQTTQIYETDITDKDGIARPVIFVKDIFLDENSTVAGIVGAFIDITERKRSEETLRIANAELERAMRMKDEFLATMSHELRTPLTGILGLSEALQMETYGNLTERQLKTIKNIEESGRHLLALINDVLDLSKIEAGKLVLDINRANLQNICQASLQPTKGMAHHKKQRVNYSLPADPIFLNVDSRRIKQVLVNLLSNAIKFTHENGDLGLIVELDDIRQQVAMTVWDNGIGIKEEHISNLFKPFTQIDGSLAREYSGTGLGLALVRKLVELHHGSVSVESTPSEGSRFTITLPWVPEPPITPISLTSDGEQSISTMPSGEPTGPMILIADDNKVLLDMMGDFLEMKQYRTVRVQSGRELLEKIESVKPDAILMDIQMPGMDGLEAIDRVRSHPNASIASTPIIAVTALAMSSDRKRCLEAGANEYLSKPIKLKYLAEILSQMTGLQ